MIGNDIIDLKQAAIDSNWRRKGYLDKICCPNEQDMIWESANADQMLWVLWSMKEAAYKIENRRNNKRFYSPASFICQQLSFGPAVVSGQVVYQESIFFVRSEISSERIHTIASCDIGDIQQIQIRLLENSASYMDEFNCLDYPYSLNKDRNGLPNVKNKTTYQYYPASVSHHGRYLAITYLNSLQ